MVTKHITIDVWEKYQKTIEVNQYEASGRTLNIKLVSHGNAIDLTDASVILYALTANGYIETTCHNVDKARGLVSYTIPSDICITSGSVPCFIEIIKDAVLRTGFFNIAPIESGDTSTAYEGTNEMTALQDLISTAMGYDSRIQQNTDDINALEEDVAQNTDDIAALQPTYSLERDINGLHLVNDEDMASDGKYYGIEGGVKGFYTPKPEQEGSWTPTLKAETTNPAVTYTRQHGYYTKIGKLVIAQFGIVLSTKAGGEGRLIIDRLPFNVATYGDLPYNACSYSGTTGVTVNDRGLIYNGTHLMIGWDGAGSMLYANNITYQFTIFGTFIYYTDD